MSSHRVLARKYRPQKFSEVIGQPGLVTVLTRAIQQHRVAQAYVLTGVRGTGKTTTARLLAKALNCTGVDGTGPMTAEPCGVCDNCVALIEERHLDVVEVDAASRTGVDDVRELLENLSYRAVMGRYKIYIIDEVHMLSRSAFNALLKTLEEPPSHVLFVFATTEIRKIPLTILSRCQRFDLKRIPVDTLAAYYGDIVEKEGFEADPAALLAIAAAADGSVRDGLSILDQALSGLDIGAKLELAVVREMLGAADGRLVDALFEALISGDGAAILTHAATLLEEGVDAAQTLQDLLARLSAVVRYHERRVVPVASGCDPAWVGRVSEQLSVPAALRLWGLLLKIVEDMSVAPDAAEAFAMGLVRACYVHDMPDMRKILTVVRQHLNAEGGDNTPTPLTISTDLKKKVI